MTTHWHTLTPEATAQTLNTDGEGLSSTEAALRLASVGPNSLPAPRPPSAALRLLRQFHNPLIYVLLASATLTALMGHWSDALVIAAVVLANGIIGFIQEGKAESALNAIRKLLAAQAIVMRDGQRQTIAARDLVPGDRLLLGSGDRVPADARLVQLDGLRVDEALLTGESVPVDKQLATAPAAAGLAEQHGLVFSGTLVTQGRAEALVIRTGLATEMGRIQQMLNSIPPVTTPLIAAMNALSLRLMHVIVVISLLAGGMAYLWAHYPLDQAVLTAVGIAVAAIPEGLPAVMTITLALGVSRMAGHRAIIRHLPAVETLGAVTVICTDKTGTLTRNEMVARALHTRQGCYQAEGEGYQPAGRIVPTPDNDPDLPLLAAVAHDCNEAQLRQTENGWALEGDPTEGALLALARKLGHNPQHSHPRLHWLPFESEHQLMASLHQDAHHQRWLYLKGAPERIAHLLGAKADPHWPEQQAGLAGQGMRVLALAAGPVQTGLSQLSHATLPELVQQQDIRWLGLVGLQDPPRAEAAEAIAACQQAGIIIKMITGDHPTTARAIGQQLGLAQADATIEGRALPTGSLADSAHRHAIFARATPEHKLRLVQALQAQGQVVAMTGDGVNDAPALRAANIGVAMGQKGTEAAREAASMVLADDHFATLAQAVRQGRIVFDNLRKTLLFALPTNGGQALTLLLALASGSTLPVTPVQILWVNLIVAVLLGLSLAVEPAEPNVMQRPPRPIQEGLLPTHLWWRVGLMSLLVALAGLGMFIWQTAQGESLASARTAAVNALVLAQCGYLLNCRRAQPGWVWRGNPWIWLGLGTCMALQYLFCEWTWAQRVFGTTSLSSEQWASGLLVLLAMALMGEGIKWLTPSPRPSAPSAHD